MAKTLCELAKKLLSEDPAAYGKLVNRPRFLCRHCGRVANKKKNLCKSRKLKSA